MKQKKFLLLTVVVLLGLTLLVYGRLPQTFFQQDEWAIFGYHISADKHGINLFDRLLIYQQETHIAPLSNLVTLIEYQLFGLRFTPYGWISVLLHAVTAVFVVLLATILTRKRWVAFVAGMLFLINSIPSQAVIWVATTTGTVGSAAFFLLSLIILIWYIQKGQRPWWMLMASMVLFLVSLGFKESTVFGFLLIPIVWVIFTPKRVWYGMVRILGTTGILGFLYFLVRLFILSMRTAPSIAPEVTVAPSVGVYIFRSLAIPVRVLAQSFVPEKAHLEIARLILRLAYPRFMIGGSPDPYLVESIIADIVTVFAFFVIVVAIVAVGRYFQTTRQRQFVKVLLLSVIFVLLSALPLVLVPGRAGYNALVDGRHMYLTSSFASILFATLLFGVTKIFVKKKQLVIFVWILVILGSAYHVQRIRTDIAHQVAIGGLRQSILKTVTTSVPTVSDRAVWYVESDTPFYGLEESIVPFQSGFGQVLLVWYNARGVYLPSCFFERQYLYILLEENYKECESRGFGYFRKKSTLNKAYEKFQFKPEEIFAFRFTSATSTFEDITDEIRSRLRLLGQL